jgi:predicted ATPase/DNA-binding SARP family transcriptional activator
VRIAILGDVQVLEGDTAIEVSGTRQRALLALLAVHAGTTLSDHRILEELWGDSLPDNPSNALQKRISELRKIVGADRLLRRSDGYVLDVPRRDIDLFEFEDQIERGRRALDAGSIVDASESLTAALSCWRGDPLAEFADLPFARATAARLEDLRWAAIEDRVEADLAMGCHHEVASELHALVDEQPLRERLIGQLMVSLYRSGRQTDALRAFSEARERLGDELGLEPGPELRALELAILNHDPGLDAPPGPAGPPRVGNLPAQVSTFVGRDADFAQLVEALRDNRLVTLTGPGGSGKTRLALEVGRHLSDTTPDGVWLAELAPLADGAAVDNTTALALGAHDTGEPLTPLERLLARLRDREAVVILDNCEHVLDSAAAVAGAVLGACPDVRLIATSREPLTIDGETQQPVPPLPIEAATRLFGLRAASVRPDFTLDESVRDDVEHVCAQLDGLPLAIELAAARVKALPVGQISARLHDRFRLLSGGNRDAPDRHRTLRAAVEWSHELLFHEEKVAFRTLSVFPATFDLPAAEAVCTAAGIPTEDVIDVLAHLVDKSLLVAAEGRYRLLETLRHFGDEQLAVHDERASASAAHAAHFLAIASAAESHIFAPEQVEWLDLLDQEIDNLRAAMRWAATHDPARALDAIATLAPAAWLRGHRQEARQVIEHLLEQRAGDRTLATCRALRWSSHLADDSQPAGEIAGSPRALSLAEDRSATALALAAELHDAAELAHCQRQHATTLVRRAVYAGETSGLEEATELAAQSEAGFRDLGDPWGEAIAVVVAMFGGLAGGDLQGTAALCARVWPLVERAGDRFLIERIYFVQALLAEVTGDAAKAEELHASGLAVSRELGFPEGIAAHRRRAPGATDADSGTDPAESVSPDELYSVAASKAAGAHEAVAAGDLDRGEQLYQEALAIYESQGDSEARTRILTGLDDIRQRRDT